MSDSFSDVNNSTGSNRPVVAGGIIVLIVAVIAAIAAGGIAFSRNDDSASATPETVTVTATPETPGASPDAPPEGTYVGEVQSVAEETAGSRWQAVATFGGDTAMIVYPDQGCAVSLQPLTDELYSSTALTKGCSGTEGAWKISVPESGLVDVVYSIGGIDQVEGTLSFGVPVEP
ncbi:hypothetical protein [Corynebacterium lubricantis]|uniref:hypothetical protein n=1 Tax=Corynebacterium lubricantis TaxID=541095 RepID=UPI00036F3CED|nr:hypothetical protein [Corynebacterium lubricantis]